MSDWAVSEPNEGLQVTPLDQANLGRLIGVYDTEEAAICAAINHARSRIDEMTKRAQEYHRAMSIARTAGGAA
jgi:hypothetical protein